MIGNRGRRTGSLMAGRGMMIVPAFRPRIRRPPEVIAFRNKRAVGPQPGVSIVAIDFRIAAPDRAAPEKEQEERSREDGGQPEAQERSRMVHGFSFVPADRSSCTTPIAAPAGSATMAFQ